jgi:hypothetical protein
MLFLRGIPSAFFAPNAAPLENPLELGRDRGSVAEFADFGGKLLWRHCHLTIIYFPGGSPQNDS